jgi:hypothetical protein
MEGEISISLLEHLLQLCLSEFAIYLPFWAFFETLASAKWLRIDSPEPGNERFFRVIYHDVHLD